MKSWKMFLSQESKQSTFSYEPLLGPNDIRLVQIHPSTNNSAQIVCAIVTTSLSNPGYPYQCLSYVWGKPDQNRRISCNDCTLNITDNLFIAMKSLRHDKDIITIWIDQLSINQEDLQERSKQVLLMAEIYQKAEKTIIWLGESAENSDLAMRLVENATKYKTKDFLSTVESAGGSMDNVISKLGAPQLHDKSWTAMRRLLQRAWFKRSWVSNDSIFAEFSTANSTTFWNGNV
jgi:heterokaryon incompatibility protein (HET)